MAISARTRLDTTPFWLTSASMPRFPRLERNETADVVIVGGGLSGLTAAYLLSAEGLSVIVLERDRCAMVDTGHTTAHLTMVTDARLSELVKNVGRDRAQAVWDAGLAAIAEIEKIVGFEEIECDFMRVPGYLHAPRQKARGQADVDFREEATLAMDLGFDASFEPEVPLMKRPGVRFEDQARFHPHQYLAGLAEAITSRGGRIFEQSAASEFMDKPFAVRANGFTVTCADVVIGTHTPLTGHSSMVMATAFQTKLALYTSYVIAGRVAPGRVPDALFWDTADPYDYVRLEPQGDHDVVIYGGEDHKTGQVDDTRACFQRLEGRFLSLLPGVEVTHHWSGQIIETADGLAYLGRNAEHQYVATGFAGNGMTFGTLGAMIATDGILGRPSPWVELFGVGRKKVRGAFWDYVKENKDYPSHLVRDRIAPAGGDAPPAIRPGEGQVLTLDGKRVAAYRDDNGAMILRSAICTHMGCEVKWNTAERTWDCPCHGSRFMPTGEVISGPAESPLREPEHEQRTEKREA